jgi:hypothetical protein
VHIQLNVDGIGSHCKKWAQWCWVIF